MLQTRIVRTLTLAAAAQPGGVAHLSAASGLVRVGRSVYVIADDELALGRFRQAGDAPGALVPLFDGDLPCAPKARKAAKPDLEALVLLPAFAGSLGGALVALGSGSRANRQRGAWFALDEDGELHGAPHRVDLAPLFERLRPTFADLNIEGAFVSSGMLCLLQRGNTRAGENACIRAALDAFIAWLQGDAAAPSVVSMDFFDLGDLDGVPLGFTDGTALPGGGWLFSAAAEDTADPYLDGRCVGSVVGQVDAAGVVRHVERLAGAPKIEGIAAAVADADSLQLWMVTDADDRRSPSLLLGAELRLAKG
ncbi:MAG: hypothetical protein H7Y61_15540 [Rhizobiales bacterium]|nr:hypothetical protein [Rhizobacter sp.]